MTGNHIKYVTLLNSRLSFGELFHRHCDAHFAVGAIATYLRVAADEASVRGYRFDTTKICNKR